MGGPGSGPQGGSQRGTSRFNSSQDMPKGGKGKTVKASSKTKTVKKLNPASIGAGHPSKHRGL